jgi:hypothetical protein
MPIPLLPLLLLLPPSRPVVVTVRGTEVRTAPYAGCSYVHSCAASFAHWQQPPVPCQRCVPADEHDCPWR